MNVYYVYAHYTTDTNELFYIGKGKKCRAFRKRYRNRYWTRIVKKHGHRVELLICNLSEEEALLQEREHIVESKPRANLTSGGEAGGDNPYTRAAVSRMWKNMTPEQRSREQRRRRAMQLERPVYCETTQTLYKSAKEASKALNLPHIIGIRRVARGERKHYKNYIFRYVTSESTDTAKAL